MRKISLIFLFTTCLITLSHYANSQGCSDAGFCTLNSFQPKNTASDAVKSNQLKIGISFGGADNSITIFGNYLEYNRMLNEKFGVGAKLTSLGQNGNDISTFGLSDLYLNANYKISNKTNLTIGTKIPLSNGNEKEVNIALPMDYQASLGTFDFIIGLGYEINNFQLVVALQQPLSQNDNQFLSDNYPVNSKLREFQSTNKFKRSGDILLRLSYPIKFGDKLKLTPSLLPIYHLSDDKYTDASGVEKDIEGSQGITLNGNAYLDYEINQKNALQLNLGAPFVVRDSRPDGLTRSFVVNLEYRVNF